MFLVARIMVTLIIICYDDYNDKRKRIYSVSALGREQEIVGNEISDALSDIFYDGFSDVDSGKNTGKKVVVLS